jgi:hypothetical protein
MATNKRLIKSNDEGGGASFNTVTYTAATTNGTYEITGVGFQPDFIWVKNRDNVENHYLIDSVRGLTNMTDKFLQSNTTNSESGASALVNGTTVTAIEDGFRVVETTINSGEFYFNGRDYVAWCWKAGGYANTFNVLENGSTTSSATAAGAGITAGLNTTNYSVSANRDAGFSVVRFDAGSTAWNVGHGLDVAPSVIISKMYTFGNAWEVYHKDLGTGKYLQLSTTDSVFTDAGAFSSVTDTTWTSYTTLTSGSYIAYCFAEVAGFSKFGSYDGSTTTPTVIDCGFEPAFVMIKSTNFAQGWYMFDNKRGNTSGAASPAILFADSSATEYNINNSALYMTFSDTGFQPATALSGVNGNGRSFIYMAFANQF